MKSAPTFTLGSSIGSKAAKVRISLHLTQQELADIAGVSKDDVDLFERNLPIILETKRRLLKELWARKLNNKDSRE